MVELLTILVAALKKVSECRLVRQAKAALGLTAKSIGASPYNHRLTALFRRSMIENAFLW